MLRSFWRTWRNRLLSEPSFQRFSADFPVTRPIAHARAAALVDLVSGFVYAQVLAACIRLDLFQQVREAPLTLIELASRASLPATHLRTLLDAAAALDLLEREGERYALGSHGAALLGNAGLGDMIAHHTALYDDLRDPVELLREGRGEQLPNYWPYAGAGAPAAVDNVSAYSALMAATQPSVARDVLDAYPLRQHKVIMDVGGGEGVFLRAVQARWPHIRTRLFDLPSVAMRAKAAGYEGECIGGDFFADRLPGGADLISFVRVLHDHDDKDVGRLLGSTRQALAPRGRVLIAEPMVGRDRFATAYLAMYLLAMGKGRPRSPIELKSMLSAAGFGKVRMLRVRTPILLRVMVAEAA